MKHYLSLQQKILARKLRAFGLPPLFGYLLAAAAFLTFSVFLFYKTGYASYLYALVALGFVSRLSERERNDFLKITYPAQAYRRIRLVENFLVALPFVVFLCCKGHVAIPSALLLSAAGLAIVRLGFGWNYTIPTPFKRYPFEFTAGFRRTFWLYLLAWFLVYKSVEVINFYLGVFAIALVFLTSLSYYLKPENEYYVWIYPLKAPAFLRTKVKTATWCASLLTVPLLLAMGYFFPSEIKTLMLVQALGYLYLIAIVLAKYAAYPLEINLPQALLFMLCFWFPPMLLVIIPLFYSQAVRQLSGWGMNDER